MNGNGRVIRVGDRYRITRPVGEGTRIEFWTAKSRNKPGSIIMAVEYVLDGKPIPSRRQEACRPQTVVRLQLVEAGSGEVLYP